MSIKNDTRLKFQYYPRILKKFVKNVWAIGKTTGPQRLPLLCIALIATLFSPIIAFILTLIHIFTAVEFTQDKKTTLINNINELNEDEFLKWVESVHPCQANTDEGDALKASMLQLLTLIQQTKITIESLKNSDMQTKIRLLSSGFSQYINESPPKIDIDQIAVKIEEDFPEKKTKAIIHLKERIALFVKAQIFDDEDFLWAMYVAYHELNFDEDKKIRSRTECEIAHFTQTWGVKHEVKAEKLIEAKNKNENTIMEIEQAAKFYRLGNPHEVPTRCYTSIFKPAISSVVIDGYKSGAVNPQL